MSEELQSEIADLEAVIADLTRRLSSAREAVQSWTDAGKSLSHQAATERAKNQGAGRGFFGGLLGSKYRSAVRAGAAASNAAISRQVASRRIEIANGKSAAQDAVRAIQDDLRQAKDELRDLKTALRSATTGKATRSRAASSTLDLLAKLKSAHDSGLLSDSEYEQKRKKLVDDL